jgi:shikimate dehydrogenase
VAPVNELPKIFGIVGENISYSLSPIIYNELFRRHGIAAVYTRFDLPKRRLGEFLAAAKLLPINGFNVTTPHKESIAKKLDHGDKVVAATGATNLVLVKSGKLFGYNTDIDGIRATIELRMNLELRHKSVLLIGAGGAARTALHYCNVKKAAAVTLAARVSARAKRFVIAARSRAKNQAIHSASLREIRSLAPYDLCINCTPIPTTKILRLQGENENCAIFDLNYVDDTIIKPRRYCDGKYMLAVQAARSFALMTNQDVTPESILGIIKKAHSR